MVQYPTYLAEGVGDSTAALDHQAQQVPPSGAESQNSAWPPANSFGAVVADGGQALKAALCERKVHVIPRAVVIEIAGAAPVAREGKVLPLIK